MKQVWERLRSELVEIIEWSDAVPGAPAADGDTLAWRFASGGDPSRSRAIRNGAQLIVREGQWAVFLDEGRIADAFGPGRHTLCTANLPVLTNLLCLPSGFESPFKAEVVFVATRLFHDLKWGTRQPLLLRDPELGPVRLRGFGSYSLRVNDPAWLVRELSGACGNLELASLSDPLRTLIVSRLADVLGRCGCPVFDLSSRTETLARDLRLALLEDAAQWGLEIPSLLIEALTLPPEVEAAMVRRNVRRLEDEPAGAGPASPPDAAAAASALAPAARIPVAERPESAANAETSAPSRPRRAPPPPPPLPGLAMPSSEAVSSAPGAAASTQATATPAAGAPQEPPQICVRSTGPGQDMEAPEPDAVSHDHGTAP